METKCQLIDNETGLFNRKVLAAILTLVMGPGVGGFFGMMGLFIHLLTYCSIPWQIHLFALIVGPISCIYIDYKLLGLSLLEQIQQNKEDMADERRRRFGY